MFLAVQKLQHLVGLDIDSFHKHVVQDLRLLFRILSISDVQMKGLPGSQGPYGCGPLFPHSFSACKSKSFSMVGQILIVHGDFLSGMNPMTNSRNCILQQSSVNCRDQCVHRECHCQMCR